MTFCTINVFSSLAQMFMSEIGKSLLLLAQVVQAVLGFHVDQWDPETGADRGNTMLNHCAQLKVQFT